MGRPGGGIREYLHAFVDFFHMIYDPNCRCTHQRHIITHKHTHTTAAGVVACVCAYVCERLGSAQMYATFFVLRVNKKAWQTAQLQHLRTLILIHMYMYMWVYVRVWIVFQWQSIIGKSVEMICVITFYRFMLQKIFQAATSTYYFSFCIYHIYLSLLQHIWLLQL